MKRNNDQNGNNHPKYIYECNDNIKTKKRAFRRNASNFEIDNDGMLCYKIPDSYNDNDSSEEYDNISEEKHENKTINNKLTKKDIIKAGKYSLHEKINHGNFDDTRKEFKKLR